LRYIFAYFYTCIKQETLAKGEQLKFIHTKLGEIMNNERIIEFLLTPLMNNYVYYASNTQQAELEPHLIDSLNICLTILPVPSSKELKLTRIGKMVNKIAKS
jgi:hypothetical protein